MPQTRELFDSLMAQAPLDGETLASLADVLAHCEEATTACAAGMLAREDAGHLHMAVLHDLDCADVVTSTRRLLTRTKIDDSALLTAQLEVCLLACQRSNETCSRHASHHEHCRICSQATQRAIDTCHQALNALRP
ncbi:hypothetical protein DPM19_08115 [Actinomadura craniellae]|uniref:Four-helix bundle copper-binding protein n=1 Tax=Actinomadura craniellae TaxID=2231787 RepID=A0A365H9G1_9ACTN|nr:hypothetical protein [Actinomadura craniellae]RAY15735.1 hypothetical protein DPM19_08115 [Actinomadura craniellae]